MKKVLLILAFAFCAACSFSAWGQKDVMPYQNAALPTEQRVADLLGRMTLDEKVAQMGMKSLNSIKRDEQGNVSEEALENFFKGGSIGCLESPFIEHWKIAAISEAADRYLREHTRLGIPAIQIAECLHGHLSLGTTIFPQSIGLGSTWNPSLIKEMASVIALEASLAGVDQALSPLFDLARDPRYGRVEECYGEDPYLVKQMGVAFVNGLQGDPEKSCNGIEPGKMAAMGKHFVAYSIPEAGINIAPAQVGERSLRELYLYPFECAVKEANIYSIMPGYHEVDGVPMHSNRWLLNDILRKEWNFDGYIFSDYGSVAMLNDFHKVAGSKDEACIQAVDAGVDVEAPGINAYRNLADLVRSGKISEAAVDAAVSRILTAKFKMGLFDRPFSVKEGDASRIHTDESVALSRRIAEESVVLLKNEGSLLPLDITKMKSIAVIGPNADKVQFGDYSITKNNDYGITVLEGIRNRAGESLKVNYAPGCGITSLSGEGLDEAVKAARRSDAVVLVLGGTSMPLSGIGWGDQNSKEVNTCGEGFDRSELNFPGIQPELLDRIVRTGKPVILVMINGRPYTIPEEVEKVGAVLEAWYPGERGGEAVAGILFGDVNPSGRLSVTFPPTTGHIPMYADYKPSGRGFYHKSGTKENPGRDYVFSAPKPLFCFGYGLSYTTFEYSDLKIENNLEKGGETVDVSCSVTNTGGRDGAEVVQLYVRDVVSSTTTPVKALKAFEKVYLKSGETKDVHLNIAADDLKIWDLDMNHVLEPGEFKVYLGSSSEDVRLEGSFNVLSENAGRKPLKLIFETDMGNDVDDVLCQVLINKYIEQGSVECLMMGLNKTGTSPAAFVDIVNTFYNHPDIPVGLAKDGVQAPDNASYAHIVANMKAPDGSPLYTRSISDYDALPDAVTLYRKTLASQPDGSVVIASVGFSTNLARLMDTGADEYSPLSGMELVRKKVRLLAVMAGNFEGSGNPEYNVVTDIASAKRVFEDWPGTIVFSPFELGLKVLYPATSIQNDFGWAGGHHPMVEAFMNYGSHFPYDRPSWDPTTVLYALEGDKWFNVSSPVDVTVDENGRTIFSPDPDGNRFYLAVSDEQAKAIVDYFVKLASSPVK